MYLYDSAADRGDMRLADVPAPSEQELYRKSKAAILAALNLNPAGGYVKGSAAGRALEDIVASVPNCSAPDLVKELLARQTPFANLFHYRMAPETYLRMLEILKNKMTACQIQMSDELKRREEEERRKRERIQQVEEEVRRQTQKI